MMNSRQALHHRYTLSENMHGGKWNVSEVVWTAEEEIQRFWNAPGSECVTLLIVVIALIFLDAFIAKKLGMANYKTHIAMVLFWVACGLGYNALYVSRHGWRDGID